MSRCEIQKAKYVQAIDIVDHFRVPLSHFIGCQAVVVRGRTKIVCLLGTYCHKRLTNGATYGIVTFDECFVIKSSHGSNSTHYDEVSLRTGIT
jgi:hypothetical protein